MPTKLVEELTKTGVLGQQAHAYRDQGYLVFEEPARAVVALSALLVFGVFLLYTAWAGPELGWGSQTGVTLLVAGTAGDHRGAAALPAPTLTPMPVARTCRSTS